MLAALVAVRGHGTAAVVVVADAVDAIVVVVGGVVVVVLLLLIFPIYQNDYCFSCYGSIRDEGAVDVGHRIFYSKYLYFQSLLVLLLVLLPYRGTMHVHQHSVVCCAAVVVVVAVVVNSCCLLFVVC